MCDASKYVMTEPMTAGHVVLVQNQAVGSSTVTPGSESACAATVSGSAESQASGVPLHTAWFDGWAAIGVDEHVWRHTRAGDRFVTVIIDLTPIRDGTGPSSHSDPRSTA